MNRDKLGKEEDKKLLGDQEIAAILSSRRRKTPLSFAEVEKLVYALRLGMARRANLENYAGFWRLRFVVFDAAGIRRRRSIVIEDPSIMGWVREYLAESRRKRSKYNRALWLGKLEECRRQVRQEGGGRFMPGEESSTSQFQ